MQCLVLAGGFGTRMKSVLGNLPKALLPIGPATFIDYQLRWLKLLGYDEVILALGYGSELIQEHLKKSANPRTYPHVRFSFDGDKPLKTGGAVRKAAAFLDDNFAVTYGDSFLFVSARALFETHRKSGAGLTIAVSRNKDKGDKSNILFRDGRILKYDKAHPTPDMEYIDYGMLVFNKPYFLSQAKEESFDLAEVMARACEQGRAAPVIVEEPFRETGSPGGYQDFCNLMLQYEYDLDRLFREKL